MGTLQLSLVLATFFLQLLSGAHSSMLNIVNKCSYTVWPGVVSSGVQSTPPISPTGFILQPGESKNISVPTSWSGRVWGRTLCTRDHSGKFSCLTGDCNSSTIECSGFGSVASLAEFTLNGAGESNFYDVSLVDGYNLPMVISPQGGNCTSSGCASDLNRSCPAELQVVNGSEVVACKSACDVFKDPQYCCTGDYASPSKCKPTDFSRFFKTACPTAYSYGYDEVNTTFVCAAADYAVTFCPSAFPSNGGDSQACRKCTASGGTCGFNSSNNQTICDCPFLSSLENECRPIDPSPSPSPSSSGINYSHGLIVGLTSVATILVCVFVLWFKRNSLSNHFHRKKTKDNTKIEAFITNFGFFAPKQYSYGQIKKMTNKFTEKLGQGGFGSVYKGKLSDGRFVAIKVLSESKGNGEDFVNEVTSISRTPHVNIVTLLGFCYKRSKRALIYEFMPHGSLDKFIYSQRSDNQGRQLEWKTLYNIALGIARGLEYLHQGCNTRILHFDIKPHNILLDDNFCPKISDFGLSKLSNTKESVVSMTHARGTPGYIAPEVFCRNFGGVSYKSDVYSYGMLILEMVGGRKNINVEVSHTSEVYFPTWIYKNLDQSMCLNLNGVVEEDEEIARKLTIVSLWCIQNDPSDRPSMTKVLEMLQGSLLSLVIPPRPFVSSPVR
ncbi:hypothetical protein V6N13_086141 [Hibiscus sabdariffa]|uniref:Protein kinase domain-containing protein n=1 Tax=Hibiscus sabdariffa TaxID=183260 RepID=A0ABR2FSA1_9ROSI